MRKLFDHVSRFEDVTITSNIALWGDGIRKELKEDVYEYEITLTWEEEQAKAESAEVILFWELPCVDVQYMWHPDARARRVLDADWRLNLESMLTGSAPLALLFNAAGENSFTFATDEVEKVTSVQFGVDDGRNVISGEIRMGLKQFAGKHTTTLRVLADFRKIPYYRVLKDVGLWWEKVLNLHPLAVPETARHPMYSSWYQFHQEISAGQLEEECVLAKELGMDTVIADDGWQTSDAGGGYGYTGDWQVCQRKIPDMKEHVKRIHALGMKYILWYSVPFIGYYSENWKRFQDKILYKVDRNAAGILDPRYPEVREYLIGIYEKAVREYDIDGFKLDFIDRFRMPPQDKLSLEMDYECVQEATKRLMQDIVTRLQSIKKDILIEFRQRYIGPKMQCFGNMFRVADCPSDITSNRVGITDLRLLSGDRAVHSDMVTWNDEESTEDAALQILNTLFGVTQLSKVLKNLTEEHRKMVKFWFSFERTHMEVLQKAELIPMEPHFLYPVIKACNEAEEIIGVYASEKVVFADNHKKISRFINATKQDFLYIFMEKKQSVTIKTCDCKGENAMVQKKELPEGINRIPVPRSGLLTLTYETEERK